MISDSGSIGDGVVIGRGGGRFGTTGKIVVIVHSQQRQWIHCPTYFILTFSLF